MTTWLIGNPDAGDDGRGTSFWREALAAVDVTVDRVLEPADLDETSFAAGDRVLAAGGDGTVQRAAIVSADAGAVLAVLPSGTANDFARSLGLDDDPATACRAVADDRRVAVDLARVGERAFINVAHAGLGAEASRAVDDADKQWLGQFSYAGRLFDRWRAARGVRGVLVCDDREYRGRWLEIGLANGAFYGGGHRIPEAAPDDGRLEVYAVRAAHPARLAWIFARVRLFGPASIDAPELVHRRCRRLRLDTAVPMPVTADGEDFGETPLDIELDAGALQVVRGPGPGALSVPEPEEAA
ncbi:diacylglycerol kinase family lipid kinase [Wenzhouxiangella sp. XN79A]|uniref:diacylglycerol/lipid kinase family protein n=1 Tax=Wenzhouxiangella sp. XN79A TaxID=2724193 RepID=UPI00144AA070|nr:diacylglycerol kinase family protein [Wenzhouxiangella sp. XN79A]NKI34660.1 diacylglycerol kinase family lipid kinase [Wenzhouxiangella sp. XN79A]